MSTPKRILFAIKNPGARRRRTLDKVIAIAKRLGASLELHNAISTPVVLELQPLTGTTLSELKRESLQLRGAQLEKLAARAHEAGLEVTVSVEWDFPPHEAIVRRARASRADLIVAECHAGKRLAPWLLHLTDWELLRDSPVPVLLIKNGRPWKRGAVLAAVDPSHAHGKPASLDEAIVTAATDLGRKLGGRLEVMHSNYPSMLPLAAVDPAMDSAAAVASYEAQVAADRREFDAFADAQRIPRRRRHVLTGSPVAGIPLLARRLRADLVVMGALARSGLQRVFIGNTAERVLNDLPCDVLVVKPPHVEHYVDPAPHGMRVVSSDPIMPLNA
jgi:universal stress protein E